jgi:exosome complex component CSL4
MVKSSESKTGQLVWPGERLGVIEEFIPDAGTYVRDGVIYSMIVGRSLLDLSTRRVSVFRLTHEIKVPKVGNTVEGQVASAQSENAMVRIFKIDNKKLSSVFSGVLHVSDVAMRYVDSMYDVCKAGDIVRATVISEKNQTYHLSTKERNLGVVFAFCSRCGGLLMPRRQDMRCSKCGNIERRKIAFDYGKEI